MARFHAVTALLVSASLILPGSLALAQPGKAKDGKGNAASGQERGKGHKHAQKNGRNLLGAKLKQNGKHALGKLKNRDVVADVRNGKVANMTAGDLTMKRVKTRQKMAMNGTGIIPAAWSGQQFAPYGGAGLQLAQYSGPGLQLAQYGGEEYYYGYCFDDGYEFTCYWYPAEDVYYSEYSWDDYDPYY
jgi:hypothetical protein